MKYKITKDYCWYNETEIVLMYFINGVAFTFDELTEEQKSDSDIIVLADKTKPLTAEDLYRSSFYLIDEQAHPCLFDVELENPEDMPEEMIYNDEDLAS